MRLRFTVSGIMLGTFLASVSIIGCGPTQTEIFDETVKEQRQQGLTATAQIKENRRLTVEAGGQVDLSRSERFTLTAIAEGKTVTAGGGQTPTPTAESESSSDEPPEGPVQSGTVTVEIGNQGTMNPEAVKIAPGTTVVWKNLERQPHSTASLPGQAEQWDSGNMAWGVLDTEPTSYEHTFTTPGKYDYKSVGSGDTGTGVVWVVEE